MKLKVDWQSAAADLYECLAIYRKRYDNPPVCATKDGIVKLNCKTERGWRTFPFFSNTVFHWDGLRLKKNGGIIYCFYLPSCQRSYFSEQFDRAETASPFSCFKAFDYYFNSVAKCTYDELINKYLTTEKTIVEMPPKLIVTEEQKLKIYDAMPDFGTW